MIIRHLTLFYRNYIAKVIYTASNNFNCYFRVVVPEPEKMVIRMYYLTSMVENRPEVTILYKPHTHYYLNVSWCYPKTLLLLTQRVRYITTLFK